MHNFVTVHDVMHADIVPDEVYVDKLEDILTGTNFYGVTPSPTAIANDVYLGTQANAESPELLKRLKIKHVLNCGGLPESLRASRTAKFTRFGVNYDEIPADDSDDSNIMGYFGRAHSFIERNRMSGRVLIYCPGVSRSGAVALSYLVRQGRRVLAAARGLKDDRRVVVCNRGFLQQVCRCSFSFKVVHFPIFCLVIESILKPDDQL